MAMGGEVPAFFFMWTAVGKVRAVAPQYHGDSELQIRSENSLSQSVFFMNATSAAIRFILK